MQGSSTTCGRCLRTKGKGKLRWRTARHLRCDCGKLAVAVLLVWVGYFQDNLSEERLPVCRGCLEIEKVTQARLDGLK